MVAKSVAFVSILLLVVIVTLVGWQGFHGSPRFDGLVISCGGSGPELELCRTSVNDWSAQVGVRVKVVAAPSDGAARFNSYLLSLVAGDQEIDIFAIDAVWPAMLGQYLLDLGPLIPIERRRAILPEAVSNNTIDGRLTAIPWFIDIGLLYYRVDLLKKYREQPPKSWDELTRIAEKIQTQERLSGKPDIYGFVFQGKAGEGLVCNAIEWFAGQGGGTVIDQQGRITVGNTQAVKAMKLASSWVGRISPRGVLSYTEEETRGLFQSGRAVFMRNWPYARSILSEDRSPVKGLFGVTHLPAGVLGGWSLAVNRASRHAGDALALVLHLTSEAEQMRRLDKVGFYPTILKAYDDPRRLGRDPLMAELRQAFNHLAVRPSRVLKSRYNRVSFEFSQSVHSSLSGSQSPENALTELRAKLVALKGNGQW